MSEVTWDLFVLFRRYLVTIKYQHNLEISIDNFCQVQEFAYFDAVTPQGQRRCGVTWNKNTLSLRIS